MLKRETRYQKSLRAVDRRLDRRPDGVIVGSATVLFVVEGQPDRGRSQQQAGPPILFSPNASGLSRRPEATRPIPRPRWCLRRRVACQHAHDADLSSRSGALGNRRAKRERRIVEVRRKNRYPTFKSSSPADEGPWMHVVLAARDRGFRSCASSSRR